MTNIESENTGTPKTSPKRSTPRKPVVKKTDAEKAEAKRLAALKASAKLAEKTGLPKDIPVPSTPSPKDSMHLSDEFIPPSITGKHPIIAKPGFVVTPVMAIPAAMTQYAGGQAVYLKYKDAPDYVENMSIVSQGSDGLARYADCALAVETQVHYDARVAYKQFLLDRDSTPTGGDVHKSILEGANFEGTGFSQSDFGSSPNQHTSSKTITEP